jgi:hypothetical protein
VTPGPGHVFSDPVPPRRCQSHAAAPRYSNDVLDARMRLLHAMTTPAAHSFNSS